MNDIKSYIQERLFELKDEKYKDFQTSLCPGTNNIIGVRTPVLRELAKEIMKQDYMSFITSKHTYYEEYLLHAIIIPKIKFKEEQERLGYIKDFIPLIYNWAICDILVSGLKSTKKNKELYYEFIKPYLISKEEFEIRFGVVMLLDYFIEDKYLKEVFEFLSNINHEGYYVKMAVAWAVSVCFVKYPEETHKYLKEKRLDKFTHNKSIQKICESYRVKEEDKKRCRELKI